MMFYVFWILIGTIIASNTTYSANLSLKSNLDSYLFPTLSVICPPGTDMDIFKSMVYDMISDTANYDDLLLISGSIMSLDIIPDEKIRHVTSCMDFIYSTYRIQTADNSNVTHSKLGALHQMIAAIKAWSLKYQIENADSIISRVGAFERDIRNSLVEVSVVLNAIVRLHCSFQLIQAGEKYLLPFIVKRDLNILIELFFFEVNNYYSSFHSQSQRPAQAATIQKYEGNIFARNHDDFQNLYRKISDEFSALQRRLYSFRLERIVAEIQPCFPDLLCFANNLQKNIESELHDPKTSVKSIDRAVSYALLNFKHQIQYIDSNHFELTDLAADEIINLVRSEWSKKILPLVCKLLDNREKTAVIIPETPHQRDRLRRKSFVSDPNDIRGISDCPFSLRDSVRSDSPGVPINSFQRLQIDPFQGQGRQVPIIQLPISEKSANFPSLSLKHPSVATSTFKTRDEILREKAQNSLKRVASEIHNNTLSRIQLLESNPGDCVETINNLFRDLDARFELAAKDGCIFMDYLLNLSFVVEASLDAHLNLGAYEQHKQFISALFAEKFFDNILSETEDGGTDPTSSESAGKACVIEPPHSTEEILADPARFLGSQAIIETYQAFVAQQYSASCSPDTIGLINLILERSIKSVK